MQDVSFSRKPIHKKRGRLRAGDYVSFNQAREFAIQLHFKTRDEWRKWARGELDGYPEKPNHIPSHPDGIYRNDGWKGWKYWLGNMTDHALD